MQQFGVEVSRDFAGDLLCPDFFVLLSVKRIQHSKPVFSGSVFAKSSADESIANEQKQLVNIVVGQCCQSCACI